MAEYFENLADSNGNNGRLTGPEMIKMAVDWEYERRRNSKLHRLRRTAGLAQPDADIGDIKAMAGRTVDTELIARLAVGSYLQRHQDLILQGPTGAGKTYVACALGKRPPPAVPGPRHPQQPLMRRPSTGRVSPARVGVCARPGPPRRAS